MCRKVYFQLKPRQFTGYLHLNDIADDFFLRAGCTWRVIVEVEISTYLQYTLLIFCSETNGLNTGTILTT